MSDIKVVGRENQSSNISSEDIQAFKQNLSGSLITPEDANYDEVRQIWNAMIDKKPAMFAQCTSTDDVVKAVEFAKSHDILVAVRSGGHQIGGNSLCDGGLVIDLSQMKDVKVDKEAKRAHVQPGNTLGDFDAKVQEFGLTTPVGINSTTGIAGLTLGGGFGWLTRKYGLTVDNLISCEVVTADGKKLKASESENTDLFWALRGGGGNFGIVTDFEYKLYDVGPEILAGLIVYPYSDAKSILSQYREFIKTMPDDMNVWSVLRKAPPLPFLPEDVHGKEVVVLAVFYAGNLEEGQAAVEPLRKFGTPVGEHVGVQPYVNWQQAFDPLLTPGSRNYWKSHNFTSLSDKTMDVVIKYAGSLPSDQCEIFLGLLGGKAGQPAPDAMAYSHRDANIVLNVHGRWEDAADDDKCIGWSREFFEASADDATGGVYINFMTADEAAQSDRIHAGFGSNYDKLVEIKRKYDPTNLFRVNQNIKP